MAIYEKLLTIQQNLKAPKSQRNNFGNYNYRNCEDILEAVKPLLVKTSTTLILSDEMVDVGERYYVKATATLIDIETGEKVSNSAFAREEETKKGMDGSQITGASSSYARKYALNGIFAIDDTKDSDYTNVGKKEFEPTEEQYKKLRFYGRTLGHVANKNNCTTGELTSEMVDAYIEACENYVLAQQAKKNKE